MTKKSGLGKGLDALIPGGEFTAVPSETASGWRDRYDPSPGNLPQPAPAAHTDQP